jgi:hypothetical protein
MTSTHAITADAAPQAPVPPPLAEAAERAAGDGQWWNRTAIAVLPLVAAVGAVLSWGSLYEAATRALGAHAPAPFGVNLAGAAFPLLVDALILGASARYVAGVKAARPVGGWRLAAHVGVAGTVLLNAAAAPTLAAVPWHVTAPIVWSVLVELVARDVLGELREVRSTRADRIPLRLWLTTPAESVRISWRMARTGATDADTARAATERCAAARDQLTAALPGARAWRRRRQITRRLWAGVLDPATLAHLIATHPDPIELHRAVLRTIATGQQPDPSPAPDSGSDLAADRGPVRRTDPAAVAACQSGPVRTATVLTVPAEPDPEDPEPDPEDPEPDPEPAAPDRTDHQRPDPAPVPADASAPSARVTADLQRVLAAVADGRLSGRITKARIREHLACSNPHAGAVNQLYQQAHNP